MTPFLSVVAAARNDDYGGDFLGRMSRFLDVVYTVGRREKLDAEVVLVEWNPPPDRPRLVDAIDWSRFDAKLPTRVVHVPHEVHDRLPNSDVMPIHEYVAKNAGVRRARGEFVLSTNPDLLLNRRLLALLSSGRLERDSFYRVDRFDVRERPPDGDADGALEFCARHVWRVHTRSRSLVLAQPPAVLQRAFWNLAGRYGPAGGLPDRDDPVRRVHTNAAGDFLLMHRDHWRRLHGYPELSVSGHADAYMCVMALAGGMRERALPPKYRIYHQEHPRAVDWSNISAATRPVADYSEFDRRARAMLRGLEPYVFNEEGWGLALDELEEDRVG